MIRADNFRLLFAGFLLAVSAPAAAQGSQADPRLVTIVFDEGQVFTINGKVKVQTTIKFAPDETIENVAVGDSNAWQIQPNKAQTILFVKPLEPSARTNMTVVTSQRTYLFDLVASPRNAPLYVMQFRYPELEAAAEAAELAAAEEAEREALGGGPNAIELAAANDPYAVADPATLNFAWTTSGESDLFPERTYDDGEAVFLTWRADAPVPAILVTNSDGVEGPVNFTVRGDTIVLETVPAQIILRSGGDTATLTNTGPSRSSAAGRQAARGL